MWVTFVVASGKALINIKESFEIKKFTQAIFSWKLDYKTGGLLKHP